MTPGTGHPDSLDLQCDGGAQYTGLAYCGATFFGAVYTDQTPGCFYRVILMDGQMNASSRKILQDMEGKQLDGCVPVTSAGTAYCEKNSLNYFVLRYQAAGSGRALGDVLRQNVISGNIAALAHLCQAYPQWQRDGVLPALLSPYDMVAAGDAVLLLPCAALSYQPDLLSLLHQSPEMIYAVPPEALGKMSIAGVSPEDMHRYAFGILLLRCFYHLPPLQDMPALLEKAVLGLLQPELTELKIPSWIAAVQASKTVIELARAMSAHKPEKRSHHNLKDLQQVLGEYIQKLQPQKVIAELRQSASKDQALLAITDMLSKHEDEQLLLTAAEIHAETGNIIQAADACEKAYALNPRGKAAGKQFALLAGGVQGDQTLQSTMLSNENADAYYHTLLWRDYKALRPAARHALQMAGYLVWRKENGREIPPRTLMEFLKEEYPEISHMQMDFYTVRLGVLFLEVLAQAKDPSVTEHLHRMKIAITAAREHQLAPPAEVHRLGLQMTAIEEKYLR